MITAIVIPADPAEPVGLEQLDEHDLGAYQRLVGGNVEVVNLDRPAASLYFNEEGKLLDLPLNQRASVLLWVHSSAFRGRDVIVGTAFVVGLPDAEGDDQTAPAELVELLPGSLRCRVQFTTGGSDQWRTDEKVFTEAFAAYLHGVQLAQRAAAIREVRVVPELDDEPRGRWYRLGMENPWIRSADDPPFTPGSFVGCYSIEELEERIGHGNWPVGTAFYYRDLCFINQVDGGDEWLTIRHGIAFESITFGPIIERGEFASLVRRPLTATREQCQELEY